MNNWPEVIRFVIQLFCAAAMFAMGLGITLDDVKAPFRNLLALAIIVLVNNLLVPILGVLIIGAAGLLQGTPLAELAEQIVPLTGGQGIGFLLLFLAAGTVVTPFLAGIAGAPIAFSRGIMVVLAGVSALILPIALALLGQFGDILAGANNALPAGSVFLTLLIYQLVPLAVGILIRSQYEVIAQHLRPLIVQFTGLSFLVVLAALIASTPGLLSLPTAATGELVEVGDPQVVTLTTPISSTAVLTQVQAMELNGSLPTDATIRSLDEEGHWLIFDNQTTYLVTATGTDLAPSLTVTPLEDPSASFTITPTIPTFQNRTAELDAGQFSHTLARILRTHGIPTGLIKQSAVLAEGTQWALVDSDTTYFVEAQPGLAENEFRLAVFQQQMDTSQLLLDFLQTLEGLPVLEPVIDFLMGLILILLPYAMFVAVTLLLVVVGNAAGTAVRSLVDASGSGIPHSLAITTAVRNVTMALIIAVNHLVGIVDIANGGDLGQNAAGVILGFFLVSLIVVAHQAVQWGKQVKMAVTVAETPAPARSAPQVINA